MGVGGWVGARVGGWVDVCGWVSGWARTRVGGWVDVCACLHGCMCVCLLYHQLCVECVCVCVCFRALSLLFLGISVKASQVNACVE